MNETISKGDLSYFIPYDGIIGGGIRVPESHSFYVCPSACGRQIAIQAFRKDEKRHVSFLYITAEDVATGYYEEIIGDAIDDLLGILEPTPKVLLITFHCIDDFLGTDEEALLGELHRRFKDLKFAICHLNPVATEDKIPFGMRTHSQLYSFIEYTGKKDNSVNIVGTFGDLEAENELFSVLADWDIKPIRQIETCKTYDEYLEMADSRLNLVLRHMGMYAAKNMEEKLDIPFYECQITYDFEKVLKNYQGLGVRLGKTCPDFQKEIGETKKEIKKTLDYIKGIPIAVDSYASMYPFALARALSSYGFSVQSVFTNRIGGNEKKEYEWLKQNYPGIRTISKESYKSLLRFKESTDVIAIGFDSAYLLRAKYFVDMRHDEGFFGFEGIQKLMKLIRKAKGRKMDWKN